MIAMSGPALTPQPPLPQAGEGETAPRYPQSLSPNTQHPAHDASVWPAVLAAGITVAFFGLITGSLSFSILGVLATVLGIGGWVGELRHASEHE